jgi:hypothetical protein
MVTPDDIKAGQIWRQKEFPCIVRYTVLLPSTPIEFALLSDPRQQGNTICTDKEGGWRWNKEDLAGHFTKFGYTCDGQLAHLLRDESIRLEMEPPKYDEVPS